MADVFISYKREDRASAQRLASELTQLGFEVWWDLELLSGQNFRKQIRTVIDQCAAAVVLWSVRAVESDFVMDEAGHAKEQDKLCPARLDDCKLPFGYGALHTVDLTTWTGKPEHEGFSQLTRALSAKKAARTTANSDDGKNAAQRLAELEAFKTAEIAGTIPALQSFLRSHPSGAFAQFVANQIEDMQARESPTGPAPASIRTPLPKWLVPALGGGALLILLAVLITLLPMMRGPVDAAPGSSPASTVAAAGAGYDLASLHPDVRQAVEAARAAEAKAEDTTKRARAAADKADEAAGRAGKGESGYQAMDFGDAEQRRFSGARKDGEFTGFGVITWGAGDRAGGRYRGEMTSGDRTGLGVYSFSPQNLKGFLRYEGEWAGDQTDGDGVFLWRDGRRYAGAWRDDLRNGSGVFFSSPDRRLYEGEWANDKRNGFGVEWDAQGKVSKAGIWTDDALAMPMTR